MWGKIYTRKQVFGRCKKKLLIFSLNNCNALIRRTPFLESSLRSMQPFTRNTVISQRCQQLNWTQRRLRCNETKPNKCLCNKSQALREPGEEVTKLISNESLATCNTDKWVCNVMKKTKCCTDGEHCHPQLKLSSLPPFSFPVLGSATSLPASLIESGSISLASCCNPPVGG